MKTGLKLMLEYTKELDVLYVEDDAMLRESTQELLENYFRHLDTEADGGAGLARYLAYREEKGRPYDLVLTDIKMPGLDGIEMSEEILKREPMQSIIFISAHNEVEYLTRSIELGVSGFIVKPINTKQLFSVLYKIAQAISDHRFVESHLDQIEAMNVQLDAQNKALTTKNAELEKSLRLLNTMIHKEQLTQISKKSQKSTQQPVESRDNQQVRDLVHDDLYELKEILVEIDVIVIDMINQKIPLKEEAVQRLASLFTKYAAVLSFYTFFHELGRSMREFGSTLVENPIPDGEERAQDIATLLETFVFVLGRWHDDLSTGDEGRINELDASLISDMHMITNLWVGEAEDVDTEDIDGIFDL